jgi:hypothetical protein
MRLVQKAGKGFRVTGARAGWCARLGRPLIPCGTIAGPRIRQQDAQPQEFQQQQLIATQVRYHAQVPLTRL